MDFHSTISSVNQILPGLWLGNEASSGDENFIKNNNIGLIINASKNIPFLQSGNNIKKIRIPIDDPGPIHDEDNDNIITIKQYLPKLCLLITEYRKNNIDVLVHCHAGAQRSAIIVAYYLFTIVHANNDKNNINPASKDIILDRIFNLIIQKRPIAFFGGKSINFRLLFH